MARKEITEAEVKKLIDGKHPYDKSNFPRITDTLIEGFSARLLRSGKVTFGYQYTDKPTSERRYMGVGLYGSVTVKEARDRAKKYAGQVSDRRDPATEQKIEDAHYRRMADLTLARLRKAFNPRDRILSAEVADDGRMAVLQPRKKPRRVRRSQLYIRQYRKARGISLTALANEIGKTKGLLSQIENGHSAPSLETLEDIAQVFRLAHAGMLFEPPVPNGWRRIMSIVPDKTLR
jgi:DNA-binding XRE family transcriptional regulator